MHLKKETTAVTTFLSILMILASLIIGGFISYLWVMSSYYNMPTNPSLSVENAVFSPNDFTRFNVTVLNPSNSVADVNITGFQVLVGSKNETFDVSAASPSFPFLLKIGAEQGFRCLLDWSPFAGENVTVEPLIDGNTTVAGLTCPTPRAELLISNFSTAEDAHHFNITVQNSADSTINLNITYLTVFAQQISGTIPTLPIVLAAGQSQVIRCTYDWWEHDGESLTITAFTDVGFEQVYQTGQILGANLAIDRVIFDNTNAGYFNITITNVPTTSGTSSTISAINVTLADNTQVTPVTTPLLNSSFTSVAANGSLSMICFWNWSAHRSEQVTVNAFTREGFPVQKITVMTPASVVWNLGSIDFDLADLGSFSVNVTNVPVSQQEINVTEVDFNQTKTSMSPVGIGPGNSSLVVCGFNWTAFMGESANITVHAFIGQNETVMSQILMVPYVKIANATFSSFATGNPFVSVTIFNSQYSPVSANITKISIMVSNGTSLPDIVGYLAVPRFGSSPYLLSIGSEVTFVCPYDWTAYTGQNLVLTVQTSEGTTFSATFQAI